MRTPGTSRTDGVTEVAAPSVLPASFAQCSVVFRDDAVFPGIQLPPELTSAVAHRRTQFLAGRYCSAEAISRLCGGPADLSIPRDDRGAPVWPASLTGSITHTRDFAWAAVTPRTAFRSVGIDTEEVVAADLGSRIANVVLTATERSAPDHMDERTWITLVFSAKEALFKCLYALVRRHIDYSAAAIEASPSGRLSAALLESLSPGLPAGTTITGGFELRNGYVHAAVWLPA